MSSQSNKQRLNQNKAELLEFCKKHNLPYKMIMEYQIRVDNRIDIYPTRKKYCILGINSWGVYCDLEEIFNKKREKPKQLIDLSERDAFIKRCHGKLST